MTAANQRIVLDGDVRQAQETLLREASAELDRAAARTATPLGPIAFGALAQGLLVPATTALASHTRDLLIVAHTLSDRMADGASHAGTAFARVEDDATTTFTGTEP